MTKRLTKLIVRGRNKDGVPSYAIPLTKAEVALVVAGMMFPE